MASTEASLGLQDSGSDTPPPSSPPRLVERQAPSCMRPSALFQRLQGLRARAAVRVVDVGNYNDPNLPTSPPSAKKAPKFSIGRSLRSMTSCLAFKAAPSLEERYVAVEEAAAPTAAFVVRHLPKRIGAGEAVQEPGGVIVSCPLTMLVDVSTFSVPGKDVFVFKILPGDFPPSHAAESSMRTSNAESSVAASPTLSSVLSAGGEVGLQLVFRQPLAAFPLAKKNFRKVELQFVAPRERDLWLHFLEKYYATFLLDSVRTGGGGGEVCISDSELRRLTEESTRLMRRKPAPAVIERYIDFFLSSAGREDADRTQKAENINPQDVPCGGILRINLGENHFETRRFAYKKAKRRSAWDGQAAAAEEEYLVMHPTTVSQRVRRVAKYKVPVGQLRVMVEEEHFGHVFFLEQRAEFTGGCTKSLLSLFQSQPSNLQVALAASPPDSSSDFAITETIQLHTSGFADRIRWLKWFEAVLRKPVVYLSRLREEKKSLERAHGPRRLCTSLCPGPLPPAVAGEGG
ncbi:uncharacterized protein Tco025E_02782 [Trypanosoma conorhini]|uniref:Uncharacterized protein n=1 Tax=Trypanosoma conorhini TaxID=83891 RepID=A0A422Q0K6_9TRYP|nr:uncharacterized protein Tco025E_02782 [Trypanosoma conorhini]RNF23490.1 hypothetical protein Tco025E_02782 [Trypanosoma conorhini]